ncbi:MAG: hypothetical protein NT105_08745 [Verrucomicrobia bacterium]|nr:hypothetical protein [Verrucomicrobiota bacterium]
MRRFSYLISILAFSVLACVFWEHIEIVTNWVVARAGYRTGVADRVRQYEHRVIEVLKPMFMSRGIEYPPSKFALVAIKDAALFQLFAYDLSGRPVHIKDYPILGQSGTLGPKLREGDRQIPEGIYRVTSLNPNSICHLSLRLDYPNEFDRSMARRDGRTRLGNDIMIHGKSLSVGCIAIGDTAVEEIFVLAARSGVQNVKIVIVPTDWRKTPFDAKLIGRPAWLTEFYAQLNLELQHFQL